MWFWHGYLFVVSSRFAHGPADTTVTHCLSLQYIQIGFTFLAPTYPGSLGQRAINWVLLLYSKQMLN